MIRRELLTRVQELIGQREAFVLATVVAARRPTSARPGDTAVVLSDGSIEGFVGGVCAASSVRLHGLRALETGEPLRLRLIPGDEDDEGTATTDGAVVERNPCLSGGTLELFLEPHLPAPRLVIVGDSPIAHALEQLGQAAGYDCRRADGVDTAAVDGAAAVVVASHGKSEEAVLTAGLLAGVPYVALVASSRRGDAVRAELELPDQLRAQLHSPAGLEIGAQSPEEIAVSILAELIAQQRADPAGAQTKVTASRSAVKEATDPVCGMRVAVTKTTTQLRLEDGPVYFCSEGCRDRYAREHSDAVAAP